MTLTPRSRLRLCVATAVAVLAALAPVTSASAITADTTAPKITSTSYKQWLVPGDMKWRGAFWSATPGYTWSSSDNVGVASHEVETWIGNGTGSRLGASTWPSIAKYVRTYSGSRRSLHTGIGEGEQSCQRVRAKDAAGNRSPWSAWKCSYAPFGEEAVDGAWDPTSFSFKLRNTGAANDRISTVPVRATGVRIRVATGPSRGRAKVYIGSTYLGTVSAAAKRSGSKYVTLRKASTLTGRIRVRTTSSSSKSFLLTGLWGIRPTSGLSSAHIGYPASHAEPDPGNPPAPVDSSDSVSPRITSFSVTPAWPSKRGSNGMYRAVATWAASDNVKVTGYLYQEKIAAGGTSFFVGGTTYTTATSQTRSPDFTGETTCFRVRARDAAGNVSPWTGWKCSTAPITVTGGRWASGGFPAIAGAAWVYASASPRVTDQTTDRFTARSLRIKVHTGPNHGKVKIYVGGTHFGTINTYARTNGSKWVVLGHDREVRGRIRVVAATKKVYVGAIYLVKDTRKAVRSEVG
ncbi:hypothetical protein WBG06_06000 [Nocardioides sp. CCNWLW239]|uniref:hypothetical protein n=1 Tax=Nocardioides sp. CCNWLW239 TaxID=3128902 RepID=UPI00301AD625